MQGEKKPQIKFNVSFSEKDSLFHVCTGEVFSEMTFGEFHTFATNLQDEIHQAWVVYDRAQRVSQRKL